MKNMFFLLMKKFDFKVTLNNVLRKNNFFLLKKYIFLKFLFLMKKIIFLKLIENMLNFTYLGIQ
jgi:hypothetical protein